MPPEPAHASAATESHAPEAQTGLDPWRRAELPPAPTPKGLAWIGTVGPGVIVLGASIGSGEFLLGPAAFVQYGLTLLWVTAVAAFLQTIFNTELMRYTLATGEPIFTGFMRTQPGSNFWAWVYTLLYVLQLGWPGWAGAAAGAIFFLIFGQLAGSADTNVVYAIGVAAFLVCVVVLLIGRRIERTLEILNWILVVVILGSFVVLAAVFVAPATWVAALAGFIGLDPSTATFSFMPEGVDFFLIGAFAAYSGAGGMINVSLSSWARDKGYGMAKVTGYIPAAVGGQRVKLAHTGYMFEPDTEGMRRWRAWWRIVRVDQWGIYFVGAILGMLLPAILYVTFLPDAADIRGLGVAAALADALKAKNALLSLLIAFLAAWILFKTQLDLLDGMTRGVTDILWTGSARLRATDVDVRLVYYGVLAVVVLWGVIALRLTQPIVLLQLGANMAGIVFIIASLHLLHVNTTLLPAALRPPAWRRVGLVATSLFYGTFVVLWLSTMM